MHLARVDKAPAIAKTIGIVAFDVEAFGRTVLQDRHGVVAAFGEQLDRFGALLRSVETVEENGPSPALGMADLADEDSLTGGFAPAIKLEIAIPNHLNELRLQRFRGAAQEDITRGIAGFVFGPELASRRIDDPFAADDDHVLLQVINMFDPLHKPFQIERLFGNEDQVGTPVSRTERDIPGVPSHHFHNGNAAMTFRRCTKALDARSWYEDGGGVTGRHVVDDIFEIEYRPRLAAFVAETSFGVRVVDTHVFIRLARIIQAQVVI